METGQRLHRRKTERKIVYGGRVGDRIMLKTQEMRRRDEDE